MRFTCRGRLRVEGIIGGKVAGEGRKLEFKDVEKSETRRNVVVVVGGKFFLALSDRNEWVDLSTRLHSQALVRLFLGYRCLNVFNVRVSYRKIKQNSSLAKTTFQEKLAYILLSAIPQPDS